MGNRSGQRGAAATARRRTGPRRAHSHPRHVWSPRAAALALGIALAGTGVTAAVSSSAQAAAAPSGVGYIRAAHLVPDLPAMDVTLSKFSGAGTGTQTPMLKIEAAYGDVGGYAPVAAGFYAVALRPAGTPATAPPLLATTIEVAPGGTYTAAGVGTKADARLALFADDLASPGEGSARVRVVNAARTASPADVVVSDGTTVAAAAAYAVPTSYARVPAGSWTLTAKPATAGAAARAGTTKVDLASGGVYTLLVLEADAGLRVSAVLDAAGTSGVPVGGAATGFGGTAATAGGTAVGAVTALPPWWVVATGAGALAVLLLLLVVSVVLGRRWVISASTAGPRHRAWTPGLS